MENTQTLLNFIKNSIQKDTGINNITDEAIEKMVTQSQHFKELKDILINYNQKPKNNSNENSGFLLKVEDTFALLNSELQGHGL